MSQLSFAQPIVLVVLALVSPIVLVSARNRLRLTTTPLRLGILATRLGVVSLIVLALAQPAWRPPGHGRAVVFAVDVSDSLSADQVAWARAWVQQAAAQLPPGSHSSVIEFGGDARLDGSDANVATDNTDLGAALKLAGDIVGRARELNPEIVLLTDGWQTAGTPPLDALPSGVAVSYVPLPPPTGGQHPIAVIHSLDAPSVVRVGDSIDVQLDLQSVASLDAQLVLRVDQTVVANGSVHLEPGDTQVSLPAPIGTAGFAQIRADLRTAGATSTLSTVVVAKPAGRVLILQDVPSEADALTALLSSQGLDVVRKAASSVPPKAEDLAEFDAVILVNTPATSLTLDQQGTLQSFVQDMGRGLLVVGGPRTFSPGGYEGTALDDMLPVSASPPVEPQQGSVALFLVIDRSGSMDIATGGGSSAATKIAMAREAAIEAAGLLQPRDTLGVIAFDSSFQWVVPPTQLNSPDDVNAIQTRIATIKAGGGTSILQPLQAAFDAAVNTDAPLKHIIMMTDGESNDRGYEDLLARMAAAHITLSTLAIGSDADTRLLTSLAHLGGGRYYFTERSSQIPRIASKETNILTRNAVVEGQVAAVVADPSPILRSISGNLPPLSGYVATTRKDRAVTALETESGQPLLAHWQYGLGRVVAWTSAAQQGWASEWANWPDAAQFWSQAVRWALPAPIQSDFQPAIQVGADGRQVTLSVQAVGADGRFADLQDTRATVLSPDGSARELPLPQRGPGLYSQETRVDQPGEYRVLFKQGSHEEVAAFATPDAIEAHSVGSNTMLLDQLANASGGHTLNSPDELAPGNGTGPGIALWPWLLLAAVVLLPLDVYIRRRT